MRVCHSFSEYVGVIESVTTIGMFDGVHLGHQKVISRCVELAKENANQSVVISFSNHPSSYFSNTDSNEFRLITSTDEKIEIFKRLGVDVLFIIPFDEFIATIPAKQFVEDILLECLHTNAFVLGYDNRFGFKREGSIEFVNTNYAKFINTFEIAAETLNNEIISSTKIKSYLQAGEISVVNQMLGRTYLLQGKVIQGNKIGRQLNFPTANLDIQPSNKFLPGLGVYLTKVNVGNEKKYGLTNIGVRPTIASDENKIHIETYIIDFDGDIYDEKLELNFLFKCRNEMKFSSLEQLKLQIAQDVSWAEDQLAKIHVTS